MRLQGLTALVTGSTRGIGRAIALRFAQEGADVILNSLQDGDPARAVTQKIRDLGVRAEHVQADIGKNEDVRRLIATALERLGKLDILVNNAGTGLTKPFASITEEEWERAMAVHLKGVFLASQLAGQAMRKKRAAPSSILLPSPGRSHCRTA